MQRRRAMFHNVRGASTAGGNERWTVDSELVSTAPGKFRANGALAVVRTLQPEQRGDVLIAMAVGHQQFVVCQRFGNH